MLTTCPPAYLPSTHPCSPATDVQLTEAAWPEGYTVSGELTSSFDSIPVGTSVRHTYTLTPAAAGVYTHGPVVVTYAAEAEGSERQVRRPAPRAQH